MYLNTNIQINMKFIKKFLESKITKIDFVDDETIDIYKDNSEVLSDLELVSDKLQSFSDIGFNKIKIHSSSSNIFAINIDTIDYLKFKDKLEEAKLINEFITNIIELYNLLEDLNLNPNIGNNSIIDISSDLERTNINYIIYFNRG